MQNTTQQRKSRFAAQPAVKPNLNSSQTKPKEKDYFDDDDEFDESLSKANSAPNDDYDPLDDFMLALFFYYFGERVVDHLPYFRAGIHEQVAQEKSVPSSKPLPQIVSYGDEDDDEEDDLEDTEANGRIYNSDDDDDNEGDSDKVDGPNENNKNPRGKLIEPLPRVDHSQMNYKSFKKLFYKESMEIQKLSDEEITQYRNELEIGVSLSHCPRPIQQFSQLSTFFPDLLLKEISKQGYEKPTPIQAQSIPIIASGHDLIGLAKTGSGKTLAYVWPMIIHILDQPQMSTEDGPIALILVPTRELANQIFLEVKKFAKLFAIRQVAIYGGAGKYEMSKSLREERPEVVVATPGRFIEMIKLKATNLTRVSYVVIDESDRLFEMGFEYQIRSILNNVQPTKQLVMFSATMKKRIESFAREMFSNANEIRVTVGKIGEANHDIQQNTQIVHNDEEKWIWLASEIDDFTANGKVLIFVLNKTTTEILTKQLKDYFQRRQLDIPVDCLHGDKDQFERTSIMKRFIRPSPSSFASTTNDSQKKIDSLTILVATDIAARGLDIKNIRTVINYDVAKNIETYVHRIGRTGRMGVEGVAPGTAYTLLTPKDSSFAVDLVQNLKLSQQPIKEDLIQLAMKDPKWHRIRHFSSGSGGANTGNKFLSMGKGGSGGNGRPNTMGMGMGLGNHQKAFTSEMIANETGSQHSFNINLPAGLEKTFQFNRTSEEPVIPMETKRKSKFDQPAPIPVASLPPPPPIPPVPSNYQSSSSVLKGFVRSSSNYTTTTNSNQLPQQPPPLTLPSNNNPLMKSFVKSTSSLSSVSSSNNQNNDSHSEQARKKSRWG
jgi:ATP-dependent RNA helicase DDX42